MSKHFAVIGNPITHSLSPVIHRHFAQQTHLDIRYERIKGDDLLFAEQVSDFFSQNGKGLNVTLPFKQKAFVMAQVTTTRCQKAGAANTLWMQDGLLHADNTDGIGFIQDVTRYLALANKNILILGAGGAARGIIYPLSEMHPARVEVACRNRDKGQQLQADFATIHCRDLTDLSGTFDLIINATSAHLTGEMICLPKEIIQQRPFCYDLSYQYQANTPFIDYVRSFGSLASDGLGMLVEQAAEAFYIWHGVRPDTAPVLEYLRS